MYKISFFITHPLLNDVIAGKNIIKYSGNHHYMNSVFIYSFHEIIPLVKNEKKSLTIYFSTSANEST